MSKHSVRGGDVAGLLRQLAKLRDKAQARTGETFPVIVVQEAGLDGFWLHRVLETEGIESHVADAASILTSRRRRRAKTDRIDGETLLRTLLAYKRGEPRVCAMVRAPSPQQGAGHCPAPAPSLPRAQDAGGGAGGARQPDQGAAVRPGRLRLRAPAS